MAIVDYRGLCEQLAADGIVGYSVLHLVNHDPAFPPQAFDAPFYGWNDADLPAYIAPPVLTLLQPASAPVGALGFNLHVRGTDFHPGDLILFDGVGRATEFVSDTELIMIADLDPYPAPQAIPVAVRAVNGGVSNTLSFAVTAT